MPARLAPALFRRARRTAVGLALVVAGPAIAVAAFSPAVHHSLVDAAVGTWHCANTASPEEGYNQLDVTVKRNHRFEIGNPGIPDPSGKSPAGRWDYAGHRVTITMTTGTFDYRLLVDGADLDAKRLRVTGGPQLRG